MLYFVECRFGSPAHEAEWNDFYSRAKLPALISVNGFYSSQRFRATSADVPTYLAIHTVRDAAVLQSADYREKGGGNFAAWQTYIHDWHRNVYDGRAAPIVARQERLVIAHHAAAAATYGLQAIHAVALDKHPAQRWLGKMAADATDALPKDSGLYVYEPLGDALFPPSAQS